MAIHRRVPDPAHSEATRDVTVPTFSYQNDGLANLIVAAWANGPFDFGSGVTGANLKDALVGPPGGSRGIPLATRQPPHGKRLERQSIFTRIWT